MGDQDIFPQEFLPNLKGASAYDRWAKANSGPNGDYTKWVKFRDDVLAGKNPTPPQMLTKNGRFLVAAGKLHMSVTDIGSAPAPVTFGVDRATMLATGGKILREDNSASSDALTGLWGEFSNNTPTRLAHRLSGGDPGLKADGTPQGNSSYREITISPGDSWQGESAQRSELGRNTTTPYYTECQPGSTAGTFALTDEGQRRIHFWSQRYHDNYIMTQNNWNLVMQNKQDQPYGANGPVDTAPALTITIFDGLIHLENFWTVRWTTPAPDKNAWIRYALEGFYTKDPALGWIRLYVDRDGDGDFLDANEMSPQIPCQTLATITVKGNSPRNVGDSLPSHMRLGMYRQQTYLSASVMDQDNVQVVGPLS